MREIDLIPSISENTGDWTVKKDISVSNITKKDIYFSPVEPGFVAWAILWKEKNGNLKLSFTEAIGNPAMWPPTYDFNSGDIEYYLKTLVSTDDGESWNDTGWREDLDQLHHGNSDHHIRHVVELEDGSLLRHYSHTKEGRKALHRVHEYDAEKEAAGDAFPFSRSPSLQEVHKKSSTIWKSLDGGESWQQIYEFVDTPPTFISGFHVLIDSTIVGIGTIVLDSLDENSQSGILVESKDGGKTWSEPVIIAKNDDLFNPQGFCEEADFVQLDNDTLLVVWRVASLTSRQLITINRDENGRWSAETPQIHKTLPHSGYPYMHRASDGTLFYYCHTAIRYSCDNGNTWNPLPLGFSYYGQLTEVGPGRMLAVTQKSMGDCSFPWKRDASMLQSTFDYRRIGVLHQQNIETASALAPLDLPESKDFHIALELMVDGAAGIAYGINDSTYRFVMLTMVVNSKRMPGIGFAGSDYTPGSPQDVFLQIGSSVRGAINIERKIAVGKIAPGEWAELQISRSGGMLQVASNLSGAEGWGGTYTTIAEENPTIGGLALFTSKSEGKFRHVRYSDTPELMRKNWLNSSAGSSRRLALDAGREE
jgi:hypothetical protein